MGRVERQSPHSPRQDVVQLQLVLELLTGSERGNDGVHRLQSLGGIVYLVEPEQCRVDVVKGRGAIHSVVWCDGAGGKADQLLPGSGERDEDKLRLT